MNKRKVKSRSISAKADYVFEVSWETCNKVGGIYTVLKSKARHLTNIYGQNYCLIGPYFEEKIKGEFQEQLVPERFKDIFNQLEEQGVKCHFGKWLIGGEPNIILIDFKNFWWRENQIKAELWQDYQIDSLGSEYGFNEPMVWSYAVGMLIEKIKFLLPEKKIVAHFHEWLSGTGLLYLKKKELKIGTVFTTHATTLGRALAYHNIDFYSILQKIDSEEEINRYNIKEKHQLEKQTALNCDIFTTVSEITALEAEHFLGRKPDVLLFNGLDLEKFLTLEEIIIKHQIQKTRLKEFLLYYFFPYFTFDLDNTLFYFIVGRYEFRAKGIDIFIKSLARLNQRLIENKSKKTIVAFFWIPTETRGIKEELLENRDFFQDIKDSLKDISWETKQKILYSFVGKKKLTEKVLFEKDFLFQMKKRLMKLERQGLPSLSTHNMAELNDPILKSFQEAGLSNKKSDKVKVISYPIYLTGHDGLSNLSYHESIEACHLGVFPSFYEPWGYTPLEAAALGVASVTTDLAGFGRYSQGLKFNKKKSQPGVFVLERYKKTEEEELEVLTDFLYQFSLFSRKQRIQNKIEARKIASYADWKFFVKNYIEAHNKAIKHQ